MDVIRNAARQNPIGATFAAIFVAAFYAVPTAGMWMQGAGWWALLIEPAMFAGMGAFIVAMNFVVGILDGR